MPQRLMIIPDTPDVLLEKRGAKRRATRIANLNYIGKNASVTFEQKLSEFLLTPSQDAELGSLYVSAVYEEVSNSRERVYEPVYGLKDYSRAVNLDTSLQGQLDTLFGSTPLLPLSQSGDLAALEANAAATPNLVSIVDRVRASIRAQNNLAVTRDEESAGVRGVGSDDASIEPFV